MTTSAVQLRRLARECGLASEFQDSRGRRRLPSAETLMAVMGTLGLDISSPEDAGRLLGRAGPNGDSAVAPVTVVWDGVPTAIEIRAQGHVAPIAVTLFLETGDTFDELAAPVATAPGIWTLQTPRGLPLGYHGISVTVGTIESQGTIICAPSIAWADTRKRWVGFLPTYALHSDRRPGIADFAQLAELGRLLKEKGDGLVGTLPLLAAFLEEPLVEPSPYSPVSRLAWNELYLDVSGGEVLPSASGTGLGRYLDYAQVYSQKRPWIAREAAAAFADPDSKADIELMAAREPHLLHYARFRAATSIQGSPWRKPAEQMTSLHGEQFDELVQFHLFAQWQADRQIANVADLSAGLYLDYPIGVHSDGFDAWRFPDQFVRGVTAGAPPDDFFDGQNWGFQPLHPSGIRRNGYDYLRSTFAHHMQHASVLRVDHVMGLHRIYVIPEGFPSDEGTYLEYPAEELYAVLCMESHRHQAMVIGEDLGTVSRDVPRAMKKHGLGGMFVEQFEMRETARVLPVAPPGSLASLGTHDTPPFARWYAGVDIEDRGDLGLVEPQQRQEEQQRRQKVIAKLNRLTGATSGESLHDALVDSLAQSPASLVLVNLEDLWLEMEPQNIPGTEGVHPNWRRRSELSLEDIDSSERVRTVLSRVASLRKAEQDD